MSYNNIFTVVHGINFQFFCSPFVMTVFPKFESKNVKVSGDTSKKELPASLPANFQINTKKAGQGDIAVSIKSPQGKSLVPKMEEIEDGTYAVNFVPDECGPYNVSIKYGGQHVEGSPFEVQAHPTGHAKKCKIPEKMERHAELGSRNHIPIDATQAGLGAVTCKIRSHTGR